MDDSIDDLTFSKRLRKPKGDITLFDKTSKFISIPKPERNSSLEIGKELMTVQGATYLRQPAIIKSIKKHDKDPAYAIKTYMRLFGLKYDQDFINKVLKESAILIAEQKNKFNRPRPDQLAPYFGVTLEVLGSTTDNTPSYPSGHSSQSRLVAEIYAAEYPSHRENLLKAAEECGFGRIMGGFHYFSDHKMGVSFAKKLYRTLKNKKMTKPVEYNKVFDLKQKKRR
jgi:hypothetical protein